MVSILLLVKLNGKQRLFNVFTEEQRRKLILFLFERMLKVLEGLSIYVTTPDDLPPGGYTIIRDEWGDINKAITKARTCIRDDFLIFPCDLPFLEREDVDFLLGGKMKVKIVSSQDGGTSALVLPVDTEIETQFGEDSFRKHLEVLEKESVEYEIYESDNFRDIDTKEDIIWALEHRRSSEFSEFIRKELGAL